MNYAILKRLFDSLFAITGLLLSFPLWAIFALLIWLGDLGPVFYFQERCGRGGEAFKCIQFRSMVAGAEEIFGAHQSTENDSRVTYIGKYLRKTAMDALPQLINIIKGEMSFVGPRALRPVEKDVNDETPRSVWEFEGFRERSSVRPGLTGVAQILAPRDAARGEKFKYDIWYIKNQSIWLDIYLIFLSFLITFAGKWEIREEKLGFLMKPLKSIVEKELG